MRDEVSELRDTLAIELARAIVGRMPENIEEAEAKQALSLVYPLADAVLSGRDGKLKASR